MTTAGQDAMALAERSAQALDRQAAEAGALETCGADSAEAVTTGAGAVHEHARGQAERAGARVEETGRSFGRAESSAVGASQHVGLLELEHAARVVADAGLASTLTSQITELVRHAADVSAASELELLATAAAARQLVTDFPGAQGERAE